MLQKVYSWENYLDSEFVTAGFPWNGFDFVFIPCLSLDTLCRRRSFIPYL